MIGRRGAGDRRRCPSKTTLAKEGIDGEQAQDQGERSRAQRDREPRYAAALRPAQRAASARPALRLRTCAVRCVLRAAGREGDQELRNACCCRQRQGDHHARGYGCDVRAVAWDFRIGSRVAAPAAAGVDRRAGAALRLLSERDDDPGRRSAGDHETSHRGADPHRDERPSLPLRNLPADPHRDPEGRRSHGQGREVAVTEILSKEFSRRSFVKGGGALVVGFSLAGAAATGKAGAAGPATSAGYLPPDNQVDSWLSVNADNTVTFKTSQIEAGTGVTTGFGMIVAEELDVSPAQVHHGPFDSWQVVNSGETGGSNGIQSTGGPPLRAAAATAKQALLKLASVSLGVAVTGLSVKDGVVSGGGKSITYGQLVGGKLLNTTLVAPTLNPGAAPSKAVGQYRVIGTNVPRVDIPDKVTGKYTYVHNVRVPGMVYARWIRPRGQGPYGTGAKLISFDESSIKHIPGARVVRKADFLVVVAEQEYEAIRGAAELKVQWKDDPILPTTGNLWKQMRQQDSAGKAPARYSENTGNVDAALRSAAQTVSGTYAYHYNGHATIGPSAAVADVRKDGAVVYSNTQKLPGMVDKLAEILKLPAKDVRVIFYEGSSSYGAPQTRWDTAPAAAVISQMIGKPVRLQLMQIGRAHV